MLSLAERGPANVEKPSTLVRGPSSRMPWAWGGLVFAVPLLEANAAGLRDLVTGVTPSSVTSPTYARDRRGNPSVQLGVTSYVEYPHHPIHDSPTTEVTVLVRLRRLGATDGFGGVISNPYAPSTPPNLTWGITADITLNLAVFGSIGIGTTENKSSVTSNLATTEDVTVILRWRSGSGVSIDVYGERGNRQHVSSAGTVSGTLAYNAGQGIRLNASEETASNYNGNYTEALVWSRMLTDTECVLLAVDPFGWCSPRRETVTLASPFPLVAPGPSTLGEVGAVLVTAPADDLERYTEVTIDTPADQTATLNLEVDGVMEQYPVAADDTFTRPVDETTETVTLVEAVSENEPLPPPE